MSGIFWRRNDSIPDALDNVADAINNSVVPGPDAARQMETSETNERVDQLLLVCAAMWELLAERAGVTEADLVTKIAEIDARDGVADGKITFSPVPCPQCQRPIFARQKRCLYCGGPRPVDSVFKSI